MLNLQEKMELKNIFFHNDSRVLIKLLRDHLHGFEKAVLSSNVKDSQALQISMAEYSGARKLIVNLETSIQEAKNLSE